MSCNQSKEGASNMRDTLFCITASVSISENLLQCELMDFTKRINVIHIETSLIAKETIEIGALFHPFFLSRLDISQGHALDLIKHGLIAILFQSEILKAQVLEKHRSTRSPVGSEIG